MYTLPGPFLRLTLLSVLALVAACSSPAAPTSSLLRLEAKAEVSETYVSSLEGEAPVLHVSVKVTNKSIVGVEVPASQCVAPFEVELYEDEKYSGSPIETKSLPQTCTFDLKVPQVLRPGDFMWYHDRLELPANGTYYGRVSMVLKKDTLLANFGPLVIDQDIM